MEEKKYKLSIITPVYNSTRTLDDYMSAILLQDYNHETIEIIFADGGSIDGTLEKIETYKSSCDIKISLLSNPL